MKSDISIYFVNPASIKEVPTEIISSYLSGKSSLMSRIKSVCFRIVSLLLLGCVFSVFASIRAFAQTEIADSVMISPIENPSVPQKENPQNNPATPNTNGGDIKHESDSTRSAEDARTPLSNLPLSFPQPYPEDLRPFTVSIPTDGRIALWRSGGLFGSAGQRSLPGMMGIESGSIFLVQQAGRFTFTAHGDAVKYGYFGGLQTIYGFGGSISYDFSDRVGITLFGSYYTPLHRGMTPGMQGYTSIPNFGGYVDYRFSDHWGVKVGGQAYRSSVNNRMEAQPIVMPYYRLSKNAELGIDVGGILYNIIKNNRNGGARGGNMNPTIPPPVMGPPPVR